MTDEELVRAAAERVMGFTVMSNQRLDEVLPESPLHERRPIWILGEGGGVSYCDGQKVRVWNPLTYDADAFMLVDKLAEQRWHLRLQTWSGEWLCEFWPTDESVPVHQLPIYSAMGDRRRAIVLAALHAVGAEVRE